MLSVLIPTRNYNCYQLVVDLHRQGEGLQVPYEILVADDDSDESMKADNRRINDLPNCRYIELNTNLGRAAIRNYLAMEARFDYLLFIDSDAQVCSDTFLTVYLESLSQAKVVCGGIIHANELPSSEVTLRYSYEKKADEERLACCRQIHPYDKFSTFNFCIEKTLFFTILFDESLTGYGFEDTLFGKELGDRNVTVLHIDNPLIHLGLESNPIYLAKVETSLKNLYDLRQKMLPYSRLLKAQERVKKLRLVWVINGGWKLFSSLLRKNLLGRHPNLLLFSLYKLGYYNSLKK